MNDKNLRNWCYYLPNTDNTKLKVLVERTKAKVSDVANKLFESRNDTTSNYSVDDILSEFKEMKQLQQELDTARKMLGKGKKLIILKRQFIERRKHFKMLMLSKRSKNLKSFGENNPFLRVEIKSMTVKGIQASKEPRGKSNN